MPITPPILPGLGVFLEVNKRRNLNCLPLSVWVNWVETCVINVLSFFYVSGSPVCSALRTAQECCGLGD